MLTWLEVDGFKNLFDVRVEFGPFTCIAGANGAGKSNLFDAIQFLSLLASKSLDEAAREVRGVVGDPRDLFWNGYAPGEHRMKFTVEMIVPQAVKDDRGRPAVPSITYLHYELELGYSPPSGIEKIGRLGLISESLYPVPLDDPDRWPRFPHTAESFRDSVLAGSRSLDAAFISTSTEDGEDVVRIHRDDGRGGRPRFAAVVAQTPATVVSTITTSDDPTILVARREMQSWRRLALEPTMLRASDDYRAPRVMDATGLHLPATLRRIGYEDGDPERVYARVVGRLADLSGLKVRTLTVHEDDGRELLTVHLTERSGMTLPARSLSEGTLRFLALCVLLEDPSVTGLLCMEEPENGIHPASIGAMVNLVRDLAVDVDYAPGADNPLRQVIINTHSPYVVQLVDPGDLLFADTALQHAPDGRTHSPGLLLRPLDDTWRTAPHGAVRQVPPIAKPGILPYLTTPPGALLTLETTT